MPCLDYLQELGSFWRQVSKAGASQYLASTLQALTAPALVDFREKRLDVRHKLGLGWLNSNRHWTGSRVLPHPMRGARRALRTAGGLSRKRAVDRAALIIRAFAAQVEVVVGLHNAGSTDLNVTTMQGSLNSVQNFAMFFQNFTEQVLAFVWQQFPQRCGARQHATDAL